MAGYSAFRASTPFSPRIHLTGSVFRTDPVSSFVRKGYDMKDFRRSVIHLFLGTFFLLFIAWVGVKAMQYHGDYERMIQDAQRFLRENGLVEFFRGKVIPFFQEKVIPFLQGIGDSVKSIKL